MTSHTPMDGGSTDTEKVGGGGGDIGTHKQSRLKCLDAFLQGSLDVNGATNSVLCGPQRQLHLHPIPTQFMPLLYTQSMVSQIPILCGSHLQLHPTPHEKHCRPIQATSLQSTTLLAAGYHAW